MDLTNFLIQGEFGNLKLGLSENLVDNIDENEKQYFDLKAPELGFSVFQNPVQITFTKGLLTSIVFNLDLDNCTIFNKYKISHSSSLEYILDIFQFKELNWEFNRKYCFRQQLFIRLDSRVNLTFQFQSGFGFLLFSAQVFSE